MRHTDMTNLDPHTQAEQVTSTQRPRDGVKARLHLRDVEPLQVPELQPVEWDETSGNYKGAENKLLRAFASLGLWVRFPDCAGRQRSRDLCSESRNPPTAD